MKRRLLAILSLVLVAVMIFALPSCGKKATEKPTESDTQASDIVGNGDINENSGVVNTPSDDELNQDNSDDENQDNFDDENEDLDDNEDEEFEEEEEFTVTEIKPTRNGKKVTFGLYPQSKVINSSLISALDTKAKDWSFANELWYTDVVKDNVKYRGVSESEGGAATWFKYEPISWTIIDENNGNALILCNTIIDILSYASSSNNYADSTIRAWLNYDFINTAFVELQQELILTTEVDNGKESTGYSNPKFTCVNTFDKVFLLSRADVKNSDYGFKATSNSTLEESRLKNITAYAIAQINGRYDASNGAWWWLRTPASAAGSDRSDLAHAIRGTAHDTDASRIAGAIDSYGVSTATGGIVPAMWICFDPDNNGGNQGGDNTGDNTGDNVGGDNVGGDNEEDNTPFVPVIEPIRNGNKVTFGVYPQSKVSSTSLVSTLNSRSATWVESNGMWYADVVSGGNKYRGVKSAQNATATWFKYEPITWTILEEKSGNALILCDMIMDILSYASSSNNYADSTIRAWLNDDFINNAFVELQMEFILTTEVDNGKESTGYSNPKFTCVNTFDKVFLLSRADVKNSDYGFKATSNSTLEESRLKNITAYAIAQINGRYDASNGAWWWLRTPASAAGSDRSDLAHAVRGTDHSSDPDRAAGAIDSYNVSTVTGGVVPAMWIVLDPDYNDDNQSGNTPVTPPTDNDDDGDDVVGGNGGDNSDNNDNNNDNDDDSTVVTVIEPTRNGNKVTFGVYPQSKVSSTSLVSTLNSKSAAWIESNGMWYADVVSGGNKYRGVKTSKTGTATWFKYEPISWTILEEKNGNAFVLCDMIIDALAYANDDNNYENSEIRAWLNEEFIESAFVEGQLDYILTTLVKNDKEGTGYGESARFYGNNTYDKVFLLSRVEVKSYGFNTNGAVEDSARQKLATAYAIANGAYVDENNGAWWWLRTPAPHSEDKTRVDLAHTIKVNGTLNNGKVNQLTGGVVPAMWICFDPDNNSSSTPEDNDEPTVCTHSGGEATCKSLAICDICGEEYGSLDSTNHEGKLVWSKTATKHNHYYNCCNKSVLSGAHDFDAGVCLDCDYACSHSFTNGYCSSCNTKDPNYTEGGSDDSGDDNGNDNVGGDTDTDDDSTVVTVIEPTRNGNKVTFGTYPQSKVTSSSIKSTLNAKNATWTESNGMWYADVVSNGVKYRGVKTAENGTATWFKYEPISWTILEEKNGNAFVLCDMIIDALAYANDDNNYENSEIRAWLNEEFIESAFVEGQLDYILTTLVKNDKEGTGYGESARFYGNNTNDKIFLLSRVEAKSYGFSTSGDTQDSKRQRTATAYAISRINGEYDASNGAWWWLRTPAPHTEDKTRDDLAHTIKINGTIYNGKVGQTAGGVVPAMWICFDPDNNSSSTPEDNDEPTVCTHSGGEATCKSLAICDICGEEYGSLDSTNHEGKLVWEKTSTKHKQYYDCCGAVKVEGSHSGGTATCTAKATCKTCGNSYGSLAAHKGTLTWETTATTHKQYYSCCGTVKVAEGAHSWDDGVCSTCDYACTEKHEDGVVCSVCGEGCAHSGGTATCKTLAKCSACGKSYGSLNANKHEGSATWTKTDTTHKNSYTCCGKTTVAQESHEWDNGACTECSFKCEHKSNEGHNCAICALALGHIYENGECVACGLSVDGSKVTFGSYPQSKVTSSSLVSTLNSKSATWAESNGKWYADVENGGENYRGVKSTQSGTATWFKYEPISWTILEEKDGKALILCDMIIEAMAYDSAKDNNYENSDIRDWLNADFINTAFSDLQKEIIATTLVKNDKEGTGYGESARFYGNNTNDKVFLLSRVEVKSYGFNTDGTVEDPARQKTATAYAIAKGAYADANGGAWWWLRTPAPHAEDKTRADLAHTIKINGTLNNGTSDQTTGGVVPAMWIEL